MRRVPLLAALAAVLAAATPMRAQTTVGELVTLPGDAPARLVGYGLVVGLDGSGDRALGGFGARHTVQSIVNLLRNFDIEVPTEVLRTRNVAAVLVTAEVSPWLRTGGRFDVSVASIGDAESLRGGQLWITPLVLAPGGPAYATAQGSVLLSDGRTNRNQYTVETSARLAAGGQLVLDLPRAAASPLLQLRRPDLSTAAKLAETINAAVGANTAAVEDAGQVRLTPPTGGSDPLPVFLARIAALPVQAAAAPTLIVDSRDGTVVAGGSLRVSEAVVTNAGITLTIGGTPAAVTPGSPAPAGAVSVAPGASVQDVAAALHAVGAQPTVIAAVFESLQAVGALHAQVVVR